MEAKRSQKRWTWEEFDALPHDDGVRYEVIDGELFMTSSPSPRHQRIAFRLAVALDSFVRRHELGEVFMAPLAVLFGEGDYLQPDILFVPTDRSHLVTKRAIEGAPGLVVEILSPSTSKRDRGIKLERYRHYSVPDYWIIDPDARTIEVWRFSLGAESREVLRVGEKIRWTPVSGGPTLEVDVAEVVPEA